MLRDTKHLRDADDHMGRQDNDPDQQQCTHGQERRRAGHSGRDKDRGDRNQH